eukprot:gene11562-12611_t
MQDIRVGVLAIQGAVEEHVNSMRKLGCIVKEIREASDISDIDGIILPGGIHSCEVTIPFDSSSIFQKEENKDAFNAIFIRAPAILKVGPDVKILATLQSKPHISALAEVLRVLNLNPSDSSSIPDINAIVAVRQNNILATAFHPELTKDLRWHNAFKNIIIEYNQR